MTDQIGLEAVLDDEDFQSGIQSYQDSLAQAETATDGFAEAAQATSEEGVQPLGDAVEKTGEQTDESNSSIGSMVTGLQGLAGAAVVTAGSMAGVVAVLRESLDVSIEYNNEVSDTARLLGTTSEEASTLIQIGDDLRIDTKQLQAAFRAAAKQGITPNIDSLKELAVEYQAITDPAERSRFAMEKFGRAGLQMARMLELQPEKLQAMADEVQSTGLIMDGFASDTLEETRLGLDSVSDGWEGLKMQLGVATSQAFGTAGEDMGGLINQMGFMLRVNNQLNNSLEMGVISLDEFNSLQKQLVLGQVDGAKITEYLTEQTTKWSESMTLAGDESSKLDSLTRTLTATMDASDDQVTLLDGAIKGLTTSYDAQRTMNTLLDEGMRLMGETMMEQERIKLALKLATEDLTGAEKAQLLEEYGTLENMVKLNEALANGTITKYDYIEAVKDGIVTQEEMATMLGTTAGAAEDTAYQLGLIETNLLRLDGLKVQATVDVELTGSGAEVSGGALLPYEPEVAFAKGGFGVIPPGYNNDSFISAAQSGEGMLVIPRDMMSTEQGILDAMSAAYAGFTGPTTTDSGGGGAVVVNINIAGMTIANGMDEAQFMARLESAMGRLVR